MPFWKKSEDPWDMEPRKASPVVEEQEMVENPLETLKSWREQRKAAKEAEKAKQPPVTCPWCGRPMERGYLDAVQGGSIWWVTRRPDLKASLLGADPKTSLRVDDEGTFLTYKTAWHCAACEKMVLDAAGMKHPYETPYDAPAEAPEEKQE